MKKSLKLERFINLEIKEGDIVRLNDGSSLTCDKSENNVYIVFSYPDLTNSELRLDEIDFTVIKTGEAERVCPSVSDTAYVQDILIQAPNGCQFRTCSNFVYKRM